MTVLSRPVMGMPVTVDIRTQVAGHRRLLAAAFQWLRWVDVAFSTYRPGSEVSRIDRGELDPAQAHPAVREVIAACDRLSELTGGYFSARATGHFDPSGYVKGWAAECLSRYLSDRGATDHCVNLGGDVRVRGHASPGTAWRVGVRDAAGRIVRVVSTSDLAVATSGAYERGCHITDPVTGRPARSPFASATVVGTDLGIADGYATALFAGADPDRLVARLPVGYGVLLIGHDGRGYSSDGFRRACGEPLAGGGVLVEHLR
jgi:thiamine biosynthesis lipoprotein